MIKYLKDAVVYSGKRISSKEITLENYVTTENLLQNKKGKTNVDSLPPNDGNLNAYENGDILISNIRPYLKKLWFATQSGGNSSDVLTLKVNQDFDSKFIYYSIFRDVFFEHMMNGSKGTKMPRGDKSQILEFPIPDFSKPTQKLIAKVLSDIDAKIELNNKINQELAVMAKTLYDYWFVQFDFPNSNGKPYKSYGGKMVYNEFLKREIPDGWMSHYLDDVVEEFTKGITTKYVESSNLVNLNQKVNQGFRLERQYFKYLNEDIEVPKNKFAKEKDILINSLGQGTIGRVHYYCENTNNVVVDQHLFILRVNQKKVTTTYLYQLLSSETYQKQIDRQITGSTGMQMLNATNLKTLKLVVPQKKILNDFENKVYSYFKKAALNEIENQKLAELRDWLLPMLMNGQVTVRDGYGDIEEELGMVAEPGAAYDTDKEAIDALFESINYDYEVAAILLLTQKRYGFTYGKKYIHKMFSNIEMVNTLPVFKGLVFEENGWGMFSRAIEKTIDNQRFIKSDNAQNGKKVLKVKSSCLNEVANWIKQSENKVFVEQVNDMLSLYEDPLIRKEMDRIELLNTVLECMKVLKTDNFEEIRLKMEKWKMKEEGYDNKAEKFKTEETRHMIWFVRDEVLK
jgi:type I restriction enzyme S subunit